MRRLLLIPLIVAAMGLAALSPASASKNAARDYHLQEMRNYQRDLADAQTVLKSKDSSEWTQEEQENYLFNALFSIYFATNAYVTEHGNHPTSWQDLSSFAGLSEWPGNPYNNWEPIEWVDNPAAFVPGGLVRQLCPPDQYSVPESPRPKTYVLSINGSSEDFTPLDPSALMPFFEGSIIPQGTAFIAGAGWESVSKTLEKRAKKEKAKQEAEQKRQQEQQPQPQAQPK